MFLCVIYLGISQSFPPAFKALSDFFGLFSEMPAESVPAVPSIEADFQNVGY